ncbi:peptidoglycan-binding domain-containing protein [Neptuniibacter sp.]|uniref:peptidoglycan-binding domain-containing protein n=1 Tax=Neptuniibacter sp. TaxID=1962643 RepID=UPI002613C077|nr:peptidoglycan-binding domain-containing protein [Neptuniibacter sp.]MCP4595647.1 peptidoglycan-binding protein [Neptuniibacter sp.]
MYLKNGSKGEKVKSVQEILADLGLKPGAIDGIFGDKTELAVIRFQEDHSLYADGIVGPNTWQALRAALEVHTDEQTLPSTPSVLQSWERVPADKFRDGYNRFFLRDDVAEAYLKVRERVIEAGGLITSSGARRSLTANVSASRSATSFHYTGRALDLFVGSGMQNTRNDPYVIVADGGRYWRVYARAEGGEQMELNAVTYGSRKNGRTVTGKFIDLTNLFQEQGFERIKSRRSFFNGGTWLGAEWWHFQYENGLENGASTFGDELLKVYTEDQLKDTPPWKYRDRVFGENWF